MKKMSIKWKVTLWYAGMLLLLVLLMLGIMVSASDRMLRSESAKLLERRVWDFMEELETEDGYPEWDEDLRFYEGGVMFSLYDSEGRLLAGGVPSDFPADTVLKAYAVQEFPGKEGKWTTYDAAVPCGEDGVFWIRGIYGPDARTSLEGILMRVFLIACPLLAAVALLVGYLITRGALLPVELIRRTAEEIGGGSDLSRRLPEEKAQGEIRQLAETFNHMFERLEASFERERQFTSDASHELRTPVSVVLSEAEYALLPDATQEEQREGLLVIRQQAQRMGELISELLLLARADHGRELLHREREELFPLLLEAAEAVGNRAAARRIAIILPENAPKLWVEADRQALLRVFGNLLENAVQYGREGGSVCLELEQKGDLAVCRIRDDGIGISAGQLPRIWDRFYRADPAHSASDGNSGLGLPIVRWITEAHGGTVSAASREGEGSCFTVSLPLKSAGSDS